MLGSGMFNMYDAANVWANDSAVFFDGVNDFALIELPQAQNTKLRNNFTLSLWVKPRTTTIDADFIIWYHEETSPGNNAFQYLWYDESEEKIKFTRTDADGNNAATSDHSYAKTKFSAWTHVAVSVDAGGLMRIFAHGAEDGTAADNPGDWTASPSNMYYGVNGAANDNFFNGYINNVAIWDGPFGGAQILDVFNAGKPKNELYSYPSSVYASNYTLFFYHVSNEKTFISDTGYQVATFGEGVETARVAFSGAIVVSKPA